MISYQHFGTTKVTKLYLMSMGIDLQEILIFQQNDLAEYFRMEYSKYWGRGGRFCCN